jgi:hypothetical protein
LTHPDRHPPERRALAQRVTGDLLALQPFTFPAPKKRDPSPPDPPERDTSLTCPAGDVKDALRRPAYPCIDCAETVPYYCTACETEWTRRSRAEVEKKTAARRAGRLRRKARALGVRRCCICRGPIPSEKRTDILHCSAKCRQVAYRERRRRAKTSACR